LGDGDDPEDMMDKFYITLPEIAISVEQDHLDFIQRKLPRSAAWQLILNYYESTGTVSQVVLRQRLSNDKLHPGLSMRQYLAEKFLHVSTPT